MSTPIKLHTRVTGQGVPLIMVHGLFGAMDNLGMLARLLENQFQIIAVDLRGHGRSPHADQMAYPDMAADLIAVMDDLGLKRAHMFGHSMGGKTVMQVALHAPERVEKLIVADIAPVQYPDHHTEILKGMQNVAKAAPKSRQDARKILSAYENEPAILSFLLTNWRRLMSNSDSDWGWRIALNTIIRDYAKIAAPVAGTPFKGDALFLRGGLSNYVRARNRDEILRKFPKANLRTIEGTGHWLHAEKPDLVARTISRFLDP